MSVNPASASRAADVIQNGVDALSRLPRLGRKVPTVAHDVRELSIRFGRGSYIIRYRLRDEKVQILRVKHSREIAF